MPIYAYKCDACGHAKDVLQKMSDAPLTDCPACGAPHGRRRRICRRKWACEEPLKVIQENLQL